MSKRLLDTIKTGDDRRRAFNHIATFYKFSETKQNHPIVQYLSQKHAAKLQRAKLDPTVMDFFLHDTYPGYKPEIGALGIQVTDRLLESLRKG